MIGSHNTMTYLRSKNKVYEIIKGYWRCQDKTLDEQIANGVRWFDIRVVLNNNQWEFAHGEIDLLMSYKTDNNTGRSAGNVRLTLDSVLSKIQKCGGYARIMLERGDEIDEVLFKEYFSQYHIAKVFPCIVGAVIKNNWQVLWNNKKNLNIIDCSYVPYKRDTSILKQLKAIIKFPFKSIKSRAENSERPTQEQIDNTECIWVYDFI